MSVGTNAFGASTCLKGVAFQLLIRSEDIHSSQLESKPPITESCILSVCLLGIGGFGSGSEVGGTGIHSVPDHMNLPSGLIPGQTYPRLIVNSLPSCRYGLKMNIKI